MKKTLALMAVILLFACSCNFNTNTVLDEADTSNTMVSNQTDDATEFLTEEPSEKASETTSDKETDSAEKIDPYFFNKKLKEKLYSAGTYAKVCEILGKEGTLVSDYEFTVWYMLGEPPYLVTDTDKAILCIKFRNSDNYAVVCEDFKTTTLNNGYDPSLLPPELSEKIFVGQTCDVVEEVISPKYIAHIEAEPIDYCWSFGDEIKIFVSFCSWNKQKNDLQVCAVKPWDYVETISDEYLSKIKAGQTYSEVCEMIDLEPRHLASGSGIYWELGDGKRLTIFFSVKPGLDCFITTGRYTLRPAN